LNLEYLLFIFLVNKTAALPALSRVDRFIETKIVPHSMPPMKRTQACQYAAPEPPSRKAGSVSNKKPARRGGNAGRALPALHSSRSLNPVANRSEAGRYLGQTMRLMAGMA
jgi:hypothetical protein